MRYGELLQPDGTVNGMTGVCGQIKIGPGAKADRVRRTWRNKPDVLTRAEVGTRATPRFTWHGFRYVQIEGLARLRNLVRHHGGWHSRRPCRRRARSSAPTRYSTIYTASVARRFEQPPRRTVRLSARERFAYGADIAVTTEAFIFNFDMRTFYAKTAQDFADEAVDGWFTVTAPFLGSRTAVSAAVVPDRLDCWRPGNDAGPVPLLRRSRSDARHYDAAREYVLLVKEKCPDLIVPQCIGDHEALETASVTLTATAHFYQWTRLVAEFATILGKTDDARRHGELADAIRCAFQRRFVHGGKVGQGRQGEQVFGLYHDLIPEADRRRRAGDLSKRSGRDARRADHGHLRDEVPARGTETGGVGGLGGAVVNRREFPGWGYMLDNHATTLWETWRLSDNVFSQNHPMFGTVDEWFIKHVLGMAPAADAVGFDQVVIRPLAVAGVTWARGTYHSVHGPVRVAWQGTDAR